jgi:hypothetical protein
VASNSASDHEALQSGALASLTRARGFSRAGYATSKIACSGQTILLALAPTRELPTLQQ